MNMRNSFATVAVAAAIAVGLPAINWAQDESGKPSGKTYESRDAQLAEKLAREAEQQAAVAEKAAFEAKREVEFKFKHFIPGVHVFLAPDDRIREAAASVRDAKDEAARAAAMAQLHSQLDQYFEQDMQSRNKEMQDIEARLQRLRAQLDRRHQKKSEIIDLQAKVAINEAEGLGFYGQSKEKEMFDVRVPVGFPVVETTSTDELIEATPAPSTEPSSVPR
jgi:phosphoenolpyruvate-protein kinase (PTS system EI component)